MFWEVNLMASKKSKTSFWKTLLISLVALVIGVGLGFVLSESFLSYKVNFHLLGVILKQGRKEPIIGVSKGYSSGIT